MMAICLDLNLFTWIKEKNWKVKQLLTRQWIKKKYPGNCNRFVSVGLQPQSVLYFDQSITINMHTVLWNSILLWIYHQPSVIHSFYQTGASTLWTQINGKFTMIVPYSWTNRKCATVALRCLWSLHVYDKVMAWKRFLYYHPFVTGRVSAAEFWFFSFGKLG